MLNAKFNLEEYCNSYKYFTIYLDLRFKKDKTKRRDILKEADIYQSAFSIAKRKCFAGYDEMVEKFERYYELKKVSNEDINQLSECLTNLFLGVYYIDDELRERSYHEIQNQKEKYDKTYISVIFNLAELLYEISNQDFDPRKIESNIQSKYNSVKYFYELLLPELKIMFWLVSFSIRKYSLIELNKIIIEIADTVSFYPYLDGYVFFRIAYAFHRIGCYEASIQYYKESLQYMIKDVNMKRAEYIQINLFVSYGNIGMLSKAYEHGKNLLRYLHSVREYQAVSYSVNYNMALICTELDKYDEALQYMKEAYKHENYKIGQIALYMFICYSLKDYEKVAELYTTNKELIETTNMEIYQRTIELIYHKITIPTEKTQLKRDWKELNEMLAETTNSNVARYIDKLK